MEKEPCKRALILGITGQTGSYLADLLLSKGYEVHGLIRRSSSFNTARIDHVFDKLHLAYGDILDPMSLQAAITRARPDEVYNLAAQSHVKVSFDQPIYSAEVGAIGAMNVLEVVRLHRDAAGHPVRYYQASSSEMFGRCEYGAKLSEATPFRPASPYGCAKVFAFHATVNYREAYGLHACNGILFNHESPRRGETFVTRKITRAVGRIKHGLQDTLRLGALDVVRDWGYAADYVEAIWRIVQHDTPDDFVVATGQTRTVRDFLHRAFHRAGIDADKHVVTDERHKRPLDVPWLCGDCSKAANVLGWRHKVDVNLLCDIMVDADLELARKDALLRGH